jgi:hypothetical protein
MTTSPERSGAAPWYCSHDSSRAATSTMVAAGLVAAAALMAFVSLLVVGDEVSALVAAMVMLVAGANTWSAGRSRSWWRADPRAGHGSRPRPAGPRAVDRPRRVDAPAPRTRVAVPATPAGAPTRTPVPAPAPGPAVVRPATVLSRPSVRSEADTVVLDRTRQPARTVVGTTAPSGGEGAAGRTTTPPPGRTSSTPAARTRRRTVLVRPVTRRVAGSRSS